MLGSVSIYFVFLFLVKVLNNALSTSKTILIQKSKWILAGITVMFSEFIALWITKSVVTTDNLGAIITVSIAAGIGCAMACVVNEKLSKEKTYINVIMSDDLVAMKDFRDFLARNHITNVASDSYTKDWSKKTITITAYPETKAESRIIGRYLEDSNKKYKRLIYVR